MTNRELADLIGTLGHDERRVATRIIERLRMGRQQYGELQLASDTRDFRNEAAEEALDLAVYQAIRCERAAADARPCPTCSVAEFEPDLAKGTDPGIPPVGIGREGQAL